MRAPQTAADSAKRAKRVLVWPEKCDKAAVTSAAAATYLVRDLITAPCEVSIRYCCMPGRLGCIAYSRSAVSTASTVNHSDGGDAAMLLALIVGHGAAASRDCQQSVGS